MSEWRPFEPSLEECAAAEARRQWPTRFRERVKFINRLLAIGDQPLPPRP